MALLPVRHFVNIETKYPLSFKKEYTVSLYSYQLNKLEKLGALYKILDDKATVLQPQFYDDYIGVIDEDKNYGYLEVSI